MDIKIDPIKTFLAGIAGGVSVAYGRLDMLIQVLLLLIIMDIFSGIVAAFTMRKLDSAIAWRGMGKKAMTLLVVAMAKAIEPLLGGAPVGTAVSGFYCAVEALSILENAINAGVPAPSFLRDALVKVRDATSGGGKGSAPPGPIPTFTIQDLDLAARAWNDRPSAPAPAPAPAIQAPAPDDSKRE